MMPSAPMAEKGMGVVYMKTSDGRPLRHPGFIPTKTELIEEFYLPHHKELDTICTESLRDYHSCLILDCRSFPLKLVPCTESHGEKPHTRRFASEPTDFTLPNGLPQKPKDYFR